MFIKWLANSASTALCLNAFKLSFTEISTEYLYTSLQNTTKALNQKATLDAQIISLFCPKTKSNLMPKMELQF